MIVHFGRSFGFVQKSDHAQLKFQTLFTEPRKLKSEADNNDSDVVSKIPRWHLKAPTKKYLTQNNYFANLIIQSNNTTGTKMKFLIPPAFFTLALPRQYFCF